MPRIVIATPINAPVEICFDLARDIDLHVKSTAGTNERAVAGVTTGLISLGEEVTWEARHFGMTQILTSRITAFDRPSHFRDSQVRGTFARFDHDHFFKNDEGATIMLDVFDYDSPFGLLGKLADRLFLREYMARFLRDRALVLKAVAEQSAADREALGRAGPQAVWWYGTSMGTTKVTFTLDDAALSCLKDAAERLSLPKSEIVREAIIEFHDRIGRLSERERVALLRAFDELVPVIPTRSAAEVDREIAGIRTARRAGGRATRPKGNL